MNLARLILEGDKRTRIEQLLREGADPNWADETGPPLVLAAGLDAVDTVLLLLNAGAHVDASDADGDTALHRAAAVNGLDAMRVLLGAGADIDVRDDEGKTPAIVAAIMGYVDACRLLQRGGADLKATDLQGRTALHWAALRNDDANLIRFLVLAGIDPGLRDAGGATPASLAERAGHTEALRGFLP